MLLGRARYQGEILDRDGCQWEALHAAAGLRSLSHLQNKVSNSSKTILTTSSCRSFDLQTPRI
uniref:Uncharacterized protein n=1 Tax=Lepeophtheirus salmonis TaxID=72036 RepID=A0A0K2UYU1_LEPSM